MTTFQRPDRNPRWAAIPDVEEAGPRAVESCVRAYGPTTPDHLHYRLGEGLGAGRKRIRSWLTDLDDRLAEVDRRRPAPARPRPVGPRPRHRGPARRAAGQTSSVTRKADLVVVGGVVSGTWSVADGRAVVSWFPEPGRPRRTRWSRRARGSPASSTGHCAA